MKKLLTLLTLAILAMGSAWAAGETYTLKLDGSATQARTDGATVDYFTVSTGGGFNAKYTGTYDGTSYSKGLKLNSSSSISFTTLASATLTIVQSIASNDGNVPTLDGAGLNKSDRVDNTTDKVGVFTIENLSVGSHTIDASKTKETGVLFIKVVYTGSVMTKLVSPEITVDSSTGRVTIGSVTNASKITYTTDGTDPTAESDEYTAAFTVEDGVIVKAIAIGDGTSYTNSDIASIQVLLDDAVIAAPVFSQFNGTFALTCTTVAASIKYSLDGGATWLDYARTLTLTETTTVKAKAVRGSKESEVTTEDIVAVAANQKTRTIYISWGTIADSSKKDKSNTKAGEVLEMASTDDAYGYKLYLNNDSKAYQSIADITYGNGDSTRGAIKLSNGAQNIIYLPDGVKATRLTLYSIINTATNTTASGWKEVNGVTDNNTYKTIPMGAYNDVADRLTNPDVRIFPLDNVTGSVSFTNAGNQLGFIIALDVIEPVSMTITSAGYATFSNANEVAIPEGVTAYYAQKKDDTTITLKEITSGYIPANTGVVVAGAADTYSASITSTGATLTEDNLLKPWLTAGTPTEAEYYTLAAGPTFKKSTGGTLAAGKAYLVLPSGEEARELKVVFGGEATGISASLNDKGQMANNKVYNLNGQRIAQPTKGLYIVNGKKVVIK